MRTPSAKRQARVKMEQRWRVIAVRILPAYID